MKITFSTLFFILLLTFSLNSFAEGCKLSNEAAQMAMSYDKDRSDSLSTNEALESFNELNVRYFDESKVMNVLLKGPRKALYTYALKYQKLPLGEITSAADFTIWVLKWPMWKIDAKKPEVYNAMEAIFSCKE